MKKLLLAISIFFVFIFGVKAETDLAPNAKSAILIEQSTGTIIYEKAAHERLAPASMTKIMSMLLIMEEIDSGRLKLNDMVLISETAAKMGGSQIFLEAGSSVKVEELLKGIAVASGNDAVVAMAEKIAGSESLFVDLMNSKVKELNLKNTNFKNSHGLDDKDHYSSAYDMAMIAQELLKHKDILNYTSIYEDYFNKPDGSQTWLVNTNKLVRFYEGIDGLKTGFTQTAMYCLTATGMKNNVRFVSVVMGEPTSELRSSDTISLLNYGFNTYKIHTILTKDKVLGKIKIEKGKKEYGTVVLVKDATKLVKISDTLEKYDYDMELANIEAPIKKGEVVGQIIFKDKDGKEVLKTDLTIKENIKKANYWDYLKKNFKEIFSGRNKN